MTGRLTTHACLVCAQHSLVEAATYPALTRVTSDSKPWPCGGRLAVCAQCGTVQKLRDSDFLADIESIYASYAIYHQSGGAEQPIFCKGSEAPSARSVRLLEFLRETIELAARIDVLDFGCGTGTALRTFSLHEPEWALFGSELSNRNVGILQDIRGFRELFTGPPAQIPRSFDLITLFHSLEHVLDPVDTLRALAGLLRDDGVLFVQVPDASRSPYDLVVADHLLHSWASTVALLAEYAGCTTLHLSDAVLPKELTWVGRKGVSASGPRSTVDPKLVRSHVEDQLAWLHRQAIDAAAIADQSRNFGIFGSSISATWLYGATGNRASFFVDEDSGRIGRDHMGVPIIDLANVPDRADIYVPLIPEIATAVVSRLSSNRLRFHVPPSTGKARPQMHEVP